jgi:AcrR family transcriptional regulator
LAATTIEAGILSPSERSRLLEAMAACCAEYGYEAATVEGVLERAGLGPDSFERHFEGKEDCALAALNQIVAETLAAVATAGSSGEEAERRLLQIRAIAELMDARPGFARLGFVEARQGGTKRMRDAYESAARVLALMMERASGNGADLPAQAARAALGGAEAVARRSLSAGGGGELSRHLPDYVYSALVPYFGQKEALRQSRAAATLLAKEE